MPKLYNLVKVLKIRYPIIGFFKDQETQDKLKFPLNFFSLTNLPKLKYNI